MRRLITMTLLVMALVAAMALPAAANPPVAACNGLDVAHEKIHGSGTQGELSLHDLRASNHCGH